MLGLDLVLACALALEDDEPALASEDDSVEDDQPTFALENWLCKGMQAITEIQFQVIQAHAEAPIKENSH